MSTVPLTKADITHVDNGIAVNSTHHPEANWDDEC